MEKNWKRKFDKEQTIRKFNIRQPNQLSQRNTFRFYFNIFAFVFLLRITQFNTIFVENINILLVYSSSSSSLINRLARWRTCLVLKWYSRLFSLNFRRRKCNDMFKRTQREKEEKISRIKCVYFLLKLDNKWRIDVNTDRRAKVYWRRVCARA